MQRGQPQQSSWGGWGQPSAAAWCPCSHRGNLQAGNRGSQHSSQLQSRLSSLAAAQTMSLRSPPANASVPELSRQSPASRTSRWPLHGGSTEHALNGHPPLLLLPAPPAFKQTHVKFIIKCAKHYFAAPDQFRMTFNTKFVMVLINQAVFCCEGFFQRKLLCGLSVVTHHKNPKQKMNPTSKTI